MSKTGILLAGGSGTRLLPLTGPGGSNKHLVCVHNKFIIDYSLQSLINLNCDTVNVILGGAHFEQVVRYLGDGSKFGCSINYLFQSEPLGIAHGISLVEKYMKSDCFYVMLGDNIFDSKISFKETNDAEILLTKSNYLSKFGVAFCEDFKIVSMIEKPKDLSLTKEKYAISGCYKFNQDFFKYFKDLKKSDRGEYEVVDILNKYHENNQLSYSLYEGLWSDAGTFQSINMLNNYFYAKDYQ